MVAMQQYEVGLKSVWGHCIQVGRSQALCPFAPTIALPSCLGSACACACAGACAYIDSVEGARRASAPRPPCARVLVTGKRAKWWEHVSPMEGGR